MRITKPRRDALAALTSEWVLWKVAAFRKRPEHFELHKAENFDRRLAPSIARWLVDNLLVERSEERRWATIYKLTETGRRFAAEAA